MVAMEQQWMVELMRHCPLPELHEPSRPADNALNSEVVANFDWPALNAVRVEAGRPSQTRMSA